MRYDLFDYQRIATKEVMGRLRRAREDMVREESPSAFALSAVTGAGKTVIATAVIESILHGSAEFNTDPDPRATFLWITDAPALNRQTRDKMLTSSDALAPSQLIVLGNDYLNPELLRGRVYFLNIQQLSISAGFAQGGRDRRKYSGWDIVANTISNDDTDLYLVLDEAHRGMKRARDRVSIVQRLISGQPGVNPPAPVVWGISATIDRFTEAMARHERTTYPPVNIDIDKVRASGIVKDQIEIDEPDDSGTYSTTLLRVAVEKTLEFERLWTDYASTEKEPTVLPVLVVQVVNEPSMGHLAEFISVIEQDWANLTPDAIVNVFGNHDDLVIGNRKVRWVRPESIQDDQTIRVVLAKEAISTGWDCPRAEVLYSERPAKDATHIAQVIGRMVRSPLARRIATEDALNSVSCFLPLFNRSTLAAVVENLTKPGEPGHASEVVVHSEVFPRNPNLDKEVFQFVKDLPSWPKPDQLASPLRRAKTLAKLLTDASRGNALLPDGGERLTLEINRTIDGLAARHADAVETGVRDIETLNVDTVAFSVLDGERVATRRRSIQTAARDIDRDTRRIINSVKEGIGKDYVRYLVNKGDTNVDILDLRTRAAAIFRVEGVVTEIETAATKWVRQQLSEFDAAIKNTTGAAMDAYMRVREQTSEQETTGIHLALTIKSPTKTSNTPDAEHLPRFAGHLFADTDGMFPAKLNEWENIIISTEINRHNFVAWYRNPSQAATKSHRIGYRYDNGTWGSLQVDVIVISCKDDGTLGASIIDPHGDHLADAKPKLRGLARFAEQFGDRFVRIQSVTRIRNGNLRSLDLLERKVRSAVDSLKETRVSTLYESDLARDYK